MQRRNLLTLALAAAGGIFAVAGKSAQAAPPDKQKVVYHLSDADNGRGSPTRIPAEFDAVFGAPPATFGLARVALDVAPPEARRTRLTVRPQELDPLDHVNNAVYADWLDEAILGAGGGAAVRAIPRLARLEYARAAAPGATVEAEVWLDGGAWSCRVGDGDGDLLRARLESVGPVA